MLRHAKERHSRDTPYRSGALRFELINFQRVNTLNRKLKKKHRLTLMLLMIRFCHVSIVPSIDSTPLFRMHARVCTTHACSRLNHRTERKTRTQKLISYEMRRHLFVKLVFVSSYCGIKSMKAQ